MKQVLIVEDDPTWVTIFEKLCRQAKLELVVANSPQIAMDVLDIVRPEVIVLDMLLATETGMALLNEMRGYSDLSSIPVIVCSTVSGVSQKLLAPFNVRYVFDKSTMIPGDIILVLKELTNGSE